MSVGGNYLIMSNTNPTKTILFAPSFWRSMSLLLAAITHLACFIAVLVNTEILLTIGYPGLAFWRTFFAIYCGVATGVVALAINQLRNFLSHANEIEAKRHELDGYETIQHSAEYYDTGESGETYDKEYEYWKTFWRDWDI